MRLMILLRLSILLMFLPILHRLARMVTIVKAIALWRNAKAKRLTVIVAKTPMLCHTLVQTGITKKGLAFARLVTVLLRPVMAMIMMMVEAVALGLALAPVMAAVVVRALVAVLVEMVRGLAVVLAKIPPAAAVAAINPKAFRAAVFRF